MSEEMEDDTKVKYWMTCQIIKQLENVKGYRTSMISLIVPPKEQICRVTKLLADEIGTASHIKTRANRLSVINALTTVHQKLKSYNKVPPNGLVIYCGSILTQDDKEKKILYELEPFKPINTSLYLCDNKFHLDHLKAMRVDDHNYGFIVIDGNSSLFGILNGNTKEVLHKLTVDLPKKHSRGGQSSSRFARLRIEKRHNYMHKVSEVAASLFINADKVTVHGLILAGPADFKTELSQFEKLDSRLRSKILKIVDVSYGGKNGFEQAIEQAADALKNVKYLHEKKLVSRYFTEIAQNTNKYCFGVEDTLQALKMGAVKYLICWENLKTKRYVLKSCATNEETIVHGLKSEIIKTHLKNKKSGKDLQVVESQLLLEWFADNYKLFGTTLEIISDRSQEGSQFVRGFGGIGGILRYTVDFQDMQLEELDINSLKEIEDY